MFHRMYRTVSEKSCPVVRTGTGKGADSSPLSKKNAQHVMRDKFSMWLGSSQVRVCMNAHAQSHTRAHVHMPDLYNSAGFPWERSLVGTGRSKYCRASSLWELRAEVQSHGLGGHCGLLRDLDPLVPHNSSQR